MENNDSDLIIIDSQDEKDSNLEQKFSSSISSNKNSENNKSKSLIEFNHKIIYINLIDNFNKNKFRYVFSEI